MASPTFTADRKRQLLIIIAVLAFARFVFTPVIESQDEQRRELAMVTQQLERSMRLVQAGALDQSLDDLTETRQSLENQFIPHTSSSEFRLSAQQRIEGVLREHSAQVNLFDWLSREEIIEGYLYRHQANIIIEGSALSLVQAQFDILEQIAGVHVVEYAFFQPRTTRSSRRFSGQNARMTLILEVSGIQL